MQEQKSFFGFTYLYKVTHIRQTYVKIAMCSILLDTMKMYLIFEIQCMGKTKTQQKVQKI